MNFYRTLDADVEKQYEAYLDYIAERKFLTGSTETDAVTELN